MTGRDTWTKVPGWDGDVLPLAETAAQSAARIRALRTGEAEDAEAGPLNPLAGADVQQAMQVASNPGAPDAGGLAVVLPALHEALDAAALAAGAAEAGDVARVVKLLGVAGRAAGAAFPAGSLEADALALVLAVIGVACGRAEAAR